MSLAAPKGFPLTGTPNSRTVVQKRIALDARFERCNFVNQSQDNALIHATKTFYHSVLFLVCSVHCAVGAILILEAQAISKMRFDDETATEAVSRRFVWIPSRA